VGRTEDLNPALDAVAAMEKRIGGRPVDEKIVFDRAGTDAASYSM
jgi:hypothetical protein